MLNSLKRQIQSFNHYNIKTNNFIIIHWKIYFLTPHLIGPTPPKGMVYIIESLIYEKIFYLFTFTKKFRIT